LATLSGTFLFSAMGDSLWSADRTRVGYTVAAEVWSNERTLVISDLDGGHATEYATGDLEFVGWADQGEYFAFRDRSSGQFFLGRVGQAANPLVQGGGSEQVVSLEWVGADTVVYTAAAQGTFTLWRQRIGEEPYLVDTTGGTIPTIDVLP
ncbi:MAG: hypothetical protein GX601_10565, partial [Anaerolineales bacterium]|nr:hypothetical protein [Anaerolineales bacterium]